MKNALTFFIGVIAAVIVLNLIETYQDFNSAVIWGISMIFGYVFSIWTDVTMDKK